MRMPTITEGALILGVVAFAIVALISVVNARKTEKMIKEVVSQQRTAIDAERQSQIERLHQENAALREELDASKRKYQGLRQKVEEAARNAKAIKAPETDSETRDRLARLGYRPRPLSR